MSKYRFKTEEEFRKEGLWYEHHPQRWNMSGNMNKYLGQDVPEKFNRACDDKIIIEYDGWAFNNQDYVLKESVSQYPKGKWYGCKRWKNKNDFVKLTKAVDDQAYFTECLDKGDYWSGKKNWWAFNDTEYPLFEADMSIVSPFLPDGHPDKILAEKSSFILPEKWCIKLTEENIETLGKWRDAGPLPNKKYAIESWYLHTPKHGARGYNEPRKDPDYTEITFEQFKQYVLTPSEDAKIVPERENYAGRTIKALVNHPEGTDVKKGEIIKIKEILDIGSYYTLEKTKAGTEGMIIKKPLHISDWELLPESPKTIDMQAIQEETKRKFPIGCKFIPLESTQTYTLIEDSYTYTIHSKQIYAHDCHGTLYNNGKWATLVSLPETKEKQKFKVGDKVRIIQRKTTNRTGDCPGWDIANGNVGDIGIITYYSEPVRPYFVSRIGSDGYIGSFDEDDLELYQTTEIDFGRLDLEDWLRETKKLNLSLKMLTLHIEYGRTCDYKKVYTKLVCEEDSAESRAKYLYNLWNSKLKEEPIVEKEEEYEDPFNFSIIKKETFIDDVQSVDVTLRTKKKTIKF
jgi:hypothetical protein